MVSSYIFCTILIIKRFVIYYESFIVIVDSVLYLILILFLLSGNAIGTHLLRDYYSDHYQTSMKDRPYLRAPSFQKILGSEDEEDDDDDLA